jgi:hypothetical protein
MVHQLKNTESHKFLEANADESMGKFILGPGAVRGGVTERDTMVAQ